MQKQAIRLIFNAKRNVHTSKLFELSGIIPITKLYEVESINPNQAGGVGVESARSNFDCLPLRPGWRQDCQTFM